MKLIYEFRYYNLLPVDENEQIYQIEELESQRKEVEKLLLAKAQQTKLIDIFSKDQEMDYDILKNIFRVRVINLENLSIKIVKDKDSNSLQIFDGEALEEKIPIKKQEDQKGIGFKMSKRIKLFNV